MSLSQLLQECERHSITLSCTGESLKVEAPKGALTLSIRDSLTEYKAELLSWLQEVKGDNPKNAILPVCIPDPDNLYEPFDFSDLQRGFFMAEDPFMEFHVRPHYYIETNYVNHDGFDVVRYEAAWNKAIRRHSKEMVVVRPQGDLQVEKNIQPLKLEVNDLRNKTTDIVNESLLELRSTMMRSELPLDRWPWIDLKISLWAEDGKQCVRIHYNHNNFFADGAGTNRLLKEVDSYFENPDLILPPLTLSIRDALLTLDEMSRSAKGNDDRRYWEDRIPNLPGPPSLPVRSGMERRTRSKMNRREFFIDADKWQRFKDNAKHHGLTPSGAVFSAYAEIIAAWSNQQHFVLSNMVTRRMNFHPEIWDLLGNFASLYPLEIDFRDGGSFVDRALRVQQQVIRDGQHLYWGGMQVMQSLNQLQDGFGRAPIPFVISSGLLMKGFHRSDFSCLETCQVMLDHQFWEVDDGRFYYVFDLLEEFFPSGMIDDMGEAYKDLLQRLSGDPDVWQENMFSVIPDRHLQERESITPLDKQIPSLMLDDLLRSQVVNQAQAPMITMPNATLSYTELNQLSDGLAQQLIEVGLQHGQTVIVMCNRGPVLLTAVYAILKAGGAYVPVDPALPQERRNFLLENTQAPIVLTEECYADQLNLPASVQLICVDINSLKQQKMSLQPITAEKTNTDLAYMIYTSGSTGQPKAVMIDHQGAMNTILDVNQRFAINSDDCIFGVSSFSFDLSVYDLFGSVAAGASLAYPEADQALDPYHWLDVLRDYKVTVWNSAPPLATLMVEAAEFRGAQLPHLRLVMLSGDWIPVDLPDRLRKIAPSAKIVSLGGATEASIWSIMYQIDEVQSDWTSIPYGYPMQNQPWYILDHWNRPVPEWTTGELYIGGVGLALGYWRDEEKTASSFITHPESGERIYRTGDVGRYLPGALIEFLGRCDSQVKIQGHRIELGEIESVLLCHELVNSVVVVVQQGEGHIGVQLNAYVVTEPTVEYEEQILRDYLVTKLPDYMVPNHFVILEKLPLSNNGKVDRKALPKIESFDSKKVITEKRPPKDKYEQDILDVWCKVLRNDEISVVDDFFDLGGQSFEAVQITGLIREIYGISLSLGDIWLDRTIEKFALRLRTDSDDTETQVLMDINQQGRGYPVFMVHPAGGNVLCYRDFGGLINRPVYAFQAPGVDGRSEPLESIELFAKTYIAELVKTQPQGSVMLGGWSSGGLIAYEMAVQLRAMGREVEGVIIIDSPAPLMHESVNDQLLFNWFLGDMDFDVSFYTALSARDHTGMNDQQQLSDAAKLMLEQGIELGADIKQLNNIYQVFKGIVRGSRIYKALKTDTDLLIVRAKDGVVDEFGQHPFADQATWGWHKLTSGKVSGKFTAGTHYTLLSSEKVDGVIAVVKQWLSSVKNKEKMEHKIAKVTPMEVI